MSVLNALIGSALLFFGRKVFWLFVAGAGFVAGMSMTSRLFQGPEWLAILIGLGVGFLAALLAVVLKRFAIGLAGFFVGGYLALQFLVPLFRLEGGWWPWLAFALGGIIGAILVNTVLDWALIVLSSLAGASLVTQALNLGRGMSLQTREMRKEQRKG
jgi:drug/metabolite transporter (DMT)-like permease